MRGLSATESFGSNDRGSVTAEFVLLLPAVMLVLSIVLGAIYLGTQRIVLVSAAGETARLEARGDWEAGAERLNGLPQGVTVERKYAGSLHCVSLRLVPGSGVLSAIEVNAMACAARTEPGFLGA